MVFFLSHDPVSKCIYMNKNTLLNVFDSSYVLPYLKSSSSYVADAGFYQAPCLDRHAALNMEPRLISIWVFWTGELSHFPFKFSNPKKKLFSTQSSLPRRTAAFLTI